MQLLVRLLNRKTGVKTAAILLVVTLLILTLATMTTGAPGVMLGDVNDDGEIDVRDVVWVMQYILDLRDLTEGQQKAADVNVDGEINVLDVTLIMQHILGITDIAKVIASVEEVEITVPYGTTVDLIEFPETVTATLQDDTEVEVDVEWEDTSDPAYQPLSANDYTFKGELVDLPLGVSNPEEIEATAVVTVAPLNIPPKLDPAPLEHSTYQFSYVFLDENISIVDYVYEEISPTPPDYIYEASPAEYVYGISAAEAVYVDVTFETDILGDIGYNNVRFAFTVTNAPDNGVVTFSSNDGQVDNLELEVDDKGYWGPSAGFDIPADYSATTGWILEFSEGGWYIITFSLIDATTEDIVDGITDSVVVFVEPLL